VTGTTLQASVSCLSTLSPLVPSNGAAQDYYGTTLAWAGTNSLVVGSPYHNNNQGTMYVYYCAGSTPTCTLVNQISASSGISTYYGYSVAASGQFVATGAYGSASVRGTAYAYWCNPTFTSCNEIIVNPADGAVNYAFGVSVSVSGSYLLVGAPDPNLAPPPASRLKSFPPQMSSLETSLALIRSSMAQSSSCPLHPRLSTTRTTKARRIFTTSLAPLSPKLAASFPSQASVVTIMATIWPWLGALW